MLASIQVYVRILIKEGQGQGLADERDCNEGWGDSEQVVHVLHSGGAARQHTHFEALVPITAEDAKVSSAYCL